MARTLRSDARALGARVSDAVPGWVGGAMAGLQAALLSLAAIVAVALAVAAVAPTPDGSAGVDWTAASSVGVRVWLLAHAVPAGDASAPIALIPLGLPLLFAFLTAALARRFAPTLGARVSLVAAYASTAAAVAWNAGTGHALTAAAAGAVVSAVGSALASGQNSNPRRARRGGSSERAPWAVALRLGTAHAVAAWAAGAGVFALWSAAGSAFVAQAAADLRPDPLGAAVLVAAGLAYAPTLSVWGVAWLAGPGFSVGEGSLYAPGTVEAHAVPAFPLLGSLPHASGGVLVGAPLVLIAVAALVARVGAGLVSAGRTGWGVRLGSVGVATAWVVVGSFAARGALGAGALSTVGADPVAVGLAFAAWTVLGVAGVGLIGGRAAAEASPGEPRSTAPVSARSRRSARPAPPRSPSRTPSARRR